MASPAPPPLWQADVLRSIAGNADKQTLNSSRGAAPAYGSSTRFAAGSSLPSDQVAEAYRHVRQVVSSDARRDLDLFDLLSSTRREETFQPYMQGVSHQAA